MYSPDLIVHLTSVHPSFDIRIFHKECKALAQAGYRIVLIARHDRDEVVDGVQIRGLAEPKNRFHRVARTALELYRLGVKENGGLYHFHDPELIPIGILLKIRGKRVIYDVHEDYPSSLLSRGWIPSSLRPYVAKGVRCLEWFGVRLFDGVVAATPSIGRRFPSCKTVIVQNYPISNKSVRDANTPYCQRSAVLTYIGEISEMRGIGEMVHAVELLQEGLQAKLWLAGRFTPSHLEQEMKRLTGWKWTRFLGWKSQEGVAAVLGQARVGLVLFHPAPNHINAQPNKLFEYMSAGLPVVASNFPLWREMIEGVGCGLLVDPLDPKEIAKRVRWLLEHPEEAEAMGRRGQEAVHKHYNWEGQAKKLLSFYSHLRANGTGKNGLAF